MLNKAEYVIIGAIILIILIGIVFYIIEDNKFKKSGGYYVTGNKMMQSGQYEEGMATCMRMSYRSGSCYAMLLVAKLRNNDTITTEFCDSFPIETEEPFWIPDKEMYINKMRELKNQCYLYVS